MFTVNDTWDLIDKKSTVTNGTINNGSSSRTNDDLLLVLQFVGSQPPKKTKQRFRPTNTVAEVANYFHKEVTLPYGLHNLVLSSYTIRNNKHQCQPNYLKKTLKELKVENNSALEFEYRHEQETSIRPSIIVKCFQLRVKWCFHQRNMLFSYSNNTTVGDLIDAIKLEFDIHASTEELELETSYGLIEVADLIKKLVNSSAIANLNSVPTVFLFLKNEKMIPQNVIIHSAMDGVVSNVVTTYQSPKTVHKICIRVHCLFSNHILILVMPSKETLYDLKKYVIENHAEKCLEAKTIELGIIKPPHELVLPDKTSLADAGIKTEMHLYADHILNKPSASKSNSLTEKHRETATTTLQTKSAITNVDQTISTLDSQSSSTEKKLPGKLDDLSVQLNISKMTNQKSFNKSIVESNNLTVMSSQAKALLPKRVHPIGLYNPGNICFMNSALQCLVHVPRLVHYFLNLFYEKTSNATPDVNLKNSCDIYGETVGAFSYLMFQLWEGLLRPVDPSRIKTLVGRIAPSFMTNKQQDAQEFLTFLLDCLHCELKENINSKSVNRGKTIIEELFFGTIESCTICSMCQTKESTTNMINFLPLSLKRQERVFTIFFIPLLGSRVQHNISAFSTDRLENLLNNFGKTSRCKLQHYLFVSTFSSSDTYLALDTPLNEIFDHRLIVREEKMGSISARLSVVKQSDPALTTLMGCLEEFLACESLNGAWFCTKGCNKETESATRKTNLCTLPPVLIFQLKRFSEANGRKYKSYQEVLFPLNGLNLSKLSVEKFRTSSAYIYDLVAVSNHIGTSSGGHYTTYARQLADDKWYHFDDTSVSEIQSTEVISKNAYLLLYIRRDQ